MLDRGHALRLADDQLAVVPRRRTRRKLLDDPNIFVVLRKLGKERMTEVEEMALEEALACREAARAGDVQARDQYYRYLGLALEAAKARAPYESPRLAAIAVREDRADDRVITGESARERLLQTVLAVIAAEDAEAAARAEGAIEGLSRAHLKSR